MTLLFTFRRGSGAFYFFEAGMGRADALLIQQGPPITIVLVIGGHCYIYLAKIY